MDYRLIIIFVDRLSIDYLSIKMVFRQSLTRIYYIAARSPVFLAMLTNNMKESKDNFVNIPDYDSGLMSEVLRFIYCNKVENLTSIAHKLIYAAENYQLMDSRNFASKKSSYQCLQKMF